MELKAFLATLSRHKLTLIIIPVLSVVITYFLVRNQPDNYTSEVQIATGLVDKSQQALKSPDGGSDSQIAQDFDNLIEIIKSNKMLDQVAYQLMIHDLTSQTPFEKPSRLMNQLNRQAKEHALEMYKKFYANREELSLYNADQEGLHVLIGSMKYDNDALLKKLSIYRAQSSDFINIEYSADDPQESAFVVNTLAHEFITYYNFVVKDNQRKAIAFLNSLAKQKKDTLDAKNNKLKAYKIQNNILNIEDESKTIYTQISDVQARLQQAQKDVISTQAAIHSIDSHLKTSDRRTYTEGITNRSLSSSIEQLNALNNRYVQSNFTDNNVKSKIDSLNQVIDAKSQQMARSNAAAATASTNTNGQQSYISQRLTLQVQYDLAKNSIGTMQSNLESLQRRLSAIVPHEAVVQQYLSEIDIAQKEYLDILNKSNQASLDANYTSQPKQLELAMPGVALASKKMLLVALSGVVSFIFVVFVLFLLYFFDNTIKSPEELANKTGSPVLGNLNLLSTATIDLRKIWTESSESAEIQQFKNSLQSIRYEVDAELGGNKVLLINSLAEGEGKTFLATNLAYAYSLINKKVLLIDGNFSNPGITKSAKSNLFLEDYLNNNSTAEVESNSSKITVLGNRNGDGSLLEITKADNIRQKFDALKSAFEIIIIEASALDTLNRSKEWNDYADKILTVFEAGKNIKEAQKVNVTYLKNYNNKFMGWVLNVVSKYEGKSPKS